MAAKEDILAQFESFNINPSEEVLSKCAEMCMKYNVNGEDLVDQWFAYTTSVLRGAAPTVEYLERMERKEFIKNKEHETKKPTTAIPEQQSPVAGPSRQPANLTNTPKTPKNNHVPQSRIQTPIQNRQLADDLIDTTMASPSLPSGLYSKRNDTLAVRCSYGPSNTDFKRKSNLELVIRPLYEDGLKPNQLIAYEILRKRVRCIDTMTEDLADAIAHKYHLRLNQEDDNAILGETMLYGRIISDSDGKINNQSILLEQTQRYKGRCVTLNLSKMAKYSLFSGQVVAVKGSYLRALHHKDKLVAEEIYSDTNFSFPDETPLTNDTLQLVVACGPFTVQDDLAFEPLQDLIKYVKEHKPHVLILTGPFYDRSHQGVHDGQLRQSFDSLFLDLIDSIMREITDTHVVVVSSQKEPHHFPVYPTPPYEVRQNYPNLTFMPDPCMVNINGLIVGLTTADILFDIGSFELNVDKTNWGPPDRMARLASYLLKQQSFYPLDPPGKNVYMDFSLMERNGVMGVKPHILVLPSNLRHFIKEIDSCLVVNPERLTKGNGGGTFTRIQVNPGLNPTVCGRTVCQVLKI